uniref:Uncharacterized protein n=1 Tax=Chenopodium quinoa TaxID=63459 RepID=A0A803N8Z2_CHEQI
MGLTLYLGMKKGNIACHKSEASKKHLLREGRLASRAYRDEAFWRSQVNFGPPNPATDEKALRNKGKRVRCHTPCLPKVPRGRARRSRATTRERIPHRQGDRRRPSQGTSRPTGNTGETWEGNPIGSQRIHSTCSLPDFIFIIFESGGKGSLFCNGKRGADLTRHNLTIHPIPMICA